jgi:DMSO reductase family type II enzyme chaperone
VYAILSQSLSFPEERFHSDIRRGFWMESLIASSGRLPYPFRIPASGGAWAVPEDFDSFQSEYIRLFQVGGRSGPPCPLHAGHYSNDRLRTLETLVRFYNFFGVQTEQGLMPDHVSVQLEFLAYLVERESEAESHSDRKSAVRAQVDFLRGHLQNWWPRLNAKLKPQRPVAFYRSLAEATSKFLISDLTYLTNRAQDL